MYNQYNPYNPYFQPNRYQAPMQNMEQPQQPMQNQYIQQTIQKSMLQGKSVDSLDVVKATEYPLDGSVSYFPLTDGSSIVTKQLMNDGTTKITIYKQVEEENNQVKYITPEELEKSLKHVKIDELDDIKEEITDLKDQIKELKKKKSE